MRESERESESTKKIKIKGVLRSKEEEDELFI